MNSFFQYHAKRLAEKNDLVCVECDIEHIVQSVDLDSVAALSELLGGEVILPLNHAHFADTFHDLVPFLGIPLFHLLGRSEFFHEFFRHWNVLLHAQFQRVPVLHATQHAMMALITQCSTTAVLNI